MNFLKSILLILISFSLLCIVGLGNNVVADDAECQVSPNPILVNQTTLISLHTDYPDASYEFSLDLMDITGETTSEIIRTDANGNYSITLGPYENTGRVYFGFDSRHSTPDECISDFNIVTATSCPSFSNYDPRPPNIYEDSNIIAYFFTPTSPFTAGEFGVQIGGDPNNPNPSEWFILNEWTLDPMRFWTTNIGTLSEGSHPAWLFSQTTATGGTPMMCYGLQDIVVQGGSGGGLGAGHNPCAGGECNTAIGNISTDPADFVSRILSIGTGVAGGIALILMVIGSIRVLTSSGDPQRVAGGRDMIVAAVAGLLFLILSVLILRFIGVHILGLE